MQLTFDRMIIGNRVIPVSAKVVQVPKYKVDQNGRILGKGHPVRDTIEWLIPVAVADRSDQPAEAWPEPRC